MVSPSDVLNADRKLLHFGLIIDVCRTFMSGSLSDLYLAHGGRAGEFG
jgi:hypothetical protein